MLFLRNKIPRPTHTHTHAVTVSLTSWGETHLEKLITPEGDHAMLMLCGHRHLTVNWLHQFADHFLICWVAFTLLVGEVAIKANNNQPSHSVSATTSEDQVYSGDIYFLFTAYSEMWNPGCFKTISKHWKSKRSLWCEEFMSLYISKIKFTDLFNGHLRLW